MFLRSQHVYINRAIYIDSSRFKLCTKFLWKFVVSYQIVGSIIIYFSIISIIIFAQFLVLFITRIMHQDPVVISDEVGMEVLDLEVIDGDGGFKQLVLDLFRYGVLAYDVDEYTI